MSKNLELKCYLVFFSTRKLWCALGESTGVSYKFCLKVSYSAIDSDFRVNESTVYIKYVALKQKYT